MKDHRPGFKRIIKHILSQEGLHILVKFTKMINSESTGKLLKLELRRIDKDKSIFQAFKRAIKSCNRAKRTGNKIPQMRTDKVMNEFVSAIAPEKTREDSALMHPMASEPPASQQYT